jgi:hypothetical protein
MSRKFLGKMTAGVVLGGAASLLIGAPGIAASGALENGSASNAKASGGERHEERHGWIYSERKWERHHGFRHHRGFEGGFEGGFGERGFGHRGFDRDFDDDEFGEEGFGHRGFGHERFGHERFGHERFGFGERRHHRFFRHVREIWIIQICKERQPAPWVASRVTGRLWQKPSPFAERRFGEDEGFEGRGFGHEGFGFGHEGFGFGRHEKFDRFDPDIGDFGRFGHEGFGEEGFGFEGGFGGEFGGEFGEFGRGEDFGRRDFDRRDHGKGERRDFKGRRDFGHPWAYFTSFRVPEWVRPGVYKAWGSCGEGRIVIHPFGHIEAGGGGTAGGDNSNTALAGGAGLLAASAIGGAALWRRRMADGTVR